MNFKDLDLKNCYDSDEDDILRDFYIPVLENSVKYHRLTGFFNSSALSIAARGIQGLLHNEGEMKLISGVVFSKKDIYAIEQGIKDPESIISNFLTNELDNIENDFVRDHILGLSWLIANNKLKIKLALIKPNTTIPNISNLGIFHQKIGIFEDLEGNNLCFSGSVNESKMAWKFNIEDFNVFRSWVKEEKKYLDSISKRFEKYWLGDTKRAKILDVPEAIRKKMIQIAPKTKEEINLEKWVNKKFSLNKLQEKDDTKKYINDVISLRDYQKEAIHSWIKNGRSGIFEMATGTGKTFTALGCVHDLLNKYKKLVIIISVPYQHLLNQWYKEIETFGIEVDRIIADSSNNNWKNEVSNQLIDIFLNYKNRIVILTTHTTLSSKDFLKIIQKNDNLNYFIIGDEVHGIGSSVRKNGLLDVYTFRLGLSATPKRWFDDIGTDFIMDYFKDIVYEFDLWKAINTVNPATGRTFLVPYKYKANYISLSVEELQDYIEKCNSIVKLYAKAKEDEESKDIYERLLFKRADIIKNAKNKYEILEELIDKIRQDIKHTLIYCSPQQIDKIMSILKKKRIISHTFTMKEKTRPDPRYGGFSQRDYILKKFEEGEYQVLVAMKCLDEGVNVPPAKRAILMASSGNPKEYIQRIGRILRRHPGKKYSVIYDMVVVPSPSKLPAEMREFEKKIFDKELSRYEEIAKNALNNGEALEEIYKLKT